MENWEELSKILVGGLSGVILVGLTDFGVGSMVVGKEESVSMRIAVAIILLLVAVVLYFVNIIEDSCKFWMTTIGVLVLYLVYLLVRKYLPDNSDERSNLIDQ